jgi:8-oxo-dGTP pyrophosphatase MutT (NUDIX family)
MSYIGAGILPYVSVHGATFYLLSQETYGEWSDGGGRPDSGELPFQCAAREFLEEAGAILGDQTALEEMLHNPEITQHITIIKENKKPYHLYLLKIDPTLVKLVPHESGGCACISCKFTPTKEKRAIQFFPSSDLFDAVRKHSTMSINGTEFVLRPAFMSEVEALPEYQSACPAAAAESWERVGQKKR